MRILEKKKKLYIVNIGCVCCKVWLPPLVISRRLLSTFFHGHLVNIPMMLGRKTHVDVEWENVTIYNTKARDESSSWRHWLVEQMMKQPDRLTNRRQPSETKTTAFSKMQISCTCSIWHKKKILNSLKYFSVKIIAHANGLNSTQHVQQTSCVCLCFSSFAYWLSVFLFFFCSFCCIYLPLAPQVGHGAKC